MALGSVTNGQFTFSGTACAYLHCMHVLCTLLHTWWYREFSEYFLRRVLLE